MQEISPSTRLALGSFVLGGMCLAAGATIFGLVLLALGVIIICVANANRKRENQQKIDEKLAAQEELERKQAYLAKQFGLDKFYVMHNDEVTAYEKGVLAMRQVGILTEQSVYQEKEQNWALHGGIAHGIAGPVAGVANAYRVMQENEKIRAENAARREWGTQQRAQYNAMADQAAANAPRPMSIYQLNREYAAIHAWSPLTLFEKVLFFNTQYNRDMETGTIFVSSSWKEKDPSVCVDGTIRAKIYNASQKCVGCAYLSFPKTGTLCKTGTISGVCTNVPYSETYSIKLEPVDLWELTARQYANIETPDNLTKEQHEAIVKELTDKYDREIA